MVYFLKCYSYDGMFCMIKHQNIKAVLASRIRQGDYATRPFPSVYKLAAELDVNPRTASKAMQALVEDGLLIKSRTGRIAPATFAQNRKLRIYMLAQAYRTPTIDDRFDAIQRLADRRGWTARLVGYAHPYDPVINETIDAADGLFVVPVDFPDAVIARLRDHARVVSLLGDLTAHGIPSLPLENPGMVDLLLDHLYAQGHRSIACFNTQPIGPAIHDRIEHWRQWMAIHRVTGPLINEPVAPPESAMIHARQVMTRWLKSGDLQGLSAVLVTTTSSAIGVMRAMADLGLRPGHDLAICANDTFGRLAECLIPSLTTALDAPEDPYFEMCLDWFAGRDTPWLGPLLVHRRDGELFIGESTSVARSPKPDAERAAIA